MLMTLLGRDTMLETNKDSLKLLWRTALKRSDLRDAFLQYLVKLVEKEVESLREVAAGRE